MAGIGGAASGWAASQRAPCEPDECVAGAAALALHGRRIADVAARGH